MVKIFDVSLLINEDTIIYPGNEPVLINQYAFRENAPVNESKITMGCHTGTHLDAPFHIRTDGQKAHEISLDKFYGKCRVLDLTDNDLEIHADDLKKFNLKKGEIILLKTQNSLRGYKEFFKNFIHVKYDAAEFMIKVGIKTLGCDYLSVKKFGGDDNVHELLINNLTLFEGLNLAEVPEGEYIFVGLPLRLEADGAPARVILIKE
jgi:arylformamidase